MTGRAVFEFFLAAFPWLDPNNFLDVIIDAEHDNVAGRDSFWSGSVNPAPEIRILVRPEPGDTGRGRICVWHGTPETPVFQETFDPSDACDAHGAAAVIVKKIKEARWAAVTRDTFRVCRIGNRELFIRDRMTSRVAARASDGDAVVLSPSRLAVLHLVTHWDGWRAPAKAWIPVSLRDGAEIQDRFPVLDSDPRIPVSLLQALSGGFGQVQDAP